MQEDFDAYVSHLDGAVVVTVAGEIDMNTEAAFEAVLEDALDQSPHLILDVDNLRFIESRGLSVIVRAIQRTEQSAGSVALRNARLNIVRTLEVAGLAHIVALD